MQSIRSQIFISLLKHRHWFRLKSKRETIDWDTSIDELREGVEKPSGLFGKLPDGIEVAPAAVTDPAGEFV